MHNEVSKSLKKDLFDCSKIGDFYDCGCAEEEGEGKAGKEKKGKGAKKEDNRGDKLEGVCKIMHVYSAQPGLTERLESRLRRHANREQWSGHVLI